MIKHRLMTEEDIGELVELGLQYAAEIYPNDPDWYNRKDITSIVQQFHDTDGQELIILEENNEILGFMGVSKMQSLMCRSKSFLQEQLFYIKPEHRKRKLGTDLIEVVKKLGEVLEVDHILIGAHYNERLPALTRLYKSLGFEQHEAIFIKRLDND